MAKKKKTEKKEIKQEQPKLQHVIHDKGEIILIPYKELPGYVLGAKYEYQGEQVRLVYIGEISKLEVI